MSATSKTTARFQVTWVKSQLLSTFMKKQFKWCRNLQPCRNVSSVTCVCVCVFSIFQKLVCIHVDNYNFMEIFFFLPLPFLRPHLQLRQIIEEGWRPNVLLLSSFLLFLFLIFLFPFVACLFLHFLPSFPRLLIFFRGLGPPTFGALGGPRTIAIRASVFKHPIMTST